jgi:uncharacterized protein YbbC (DUF1343 family)
MAVPILRTGLEVLWHSRFAALRGKRIGLVTHPAALGVDWGTAAELFAEAPDLELVRLFGPEHGLAGAAQDLEGVTEEPRDPITGVPIVGLYGDTFESLKPTPEQLRGLDVLVIDLQDVGSRYYTFQATMLYCLEACAAVGLPVMVLDRPNPLGGVEVEGPTVRPGFESFVGVHPIPTRHGMTIGELARLYKAERVPGVALTVVPCEGWTRSDGWRDRFWFPPSPNMPTVATAAVYPGMCLIEGTNLSEGRGTTQPFEYVGFPGIDPRELADRLNGHSYPGARYLPVTFRPTFQKHARQSCGGVFVAVWDRGSFRSVKGGLLVLMTFRELLGEKFRWRTERYEFVDDKPAIDLLFGSDRERLALEAGDSWREIAAAWEPEETAFRERRKPYLLYPD